MHRRMSADESVFDIPQRPPEESLFAPGLCDWYGLERELPGRGLKPEEVIADITGGQKPMTAGMALACLAKNLDMQYMKARRNERGEPDRSVPPEPVKIDTTFIPSGAP